MNMIWIATCAALLATAAPALAQTETIETAFDTIIAPCLDGQRDKTNPPQADVDACLPGLAALDAAYAARTAPSPHDTNMLHFYRAFLHTSIGAGYAAIDGVRSSRVCSSTEASWEAVSRFSDAGSPGYAASFAKMRESAISPVTRCRAEKGAPAGATPLP